MEDKIFEVSFGYLVRIGMCDLYSAYNIEVPQELIQKVVSKPVEFEDYKGKRYLTEKGLKQLTEYFTITGYPEFAERFRSKPNSI